MTSPGRTPQFERNRALEALLAELNGKLKPVQTEVSQAHAAPVRPPVMIVGCPRAGTTLALQWLAASGRFGYPSNLMSRFFQAPWVGATLQVMLSQERYRFRDELDDVRPFGPEAGFSSDIGKTRGLLSPHVFWYFWRHYLPFGDTSTLDTRSLDPAPFVQALASVDAVFGLPFVLKGMIVNWDLPRVSSWFPRLVFLHVRRDPIAVMASVLKARLRFGGDESAWWSFKPPEFEELRELPPRLQVATFVWSCQHHVAKGLQQLPSSRHLTLDYARLCAEPDASWEALRQRIQAQGWDIGAPPSEHGPLRAGGVTAAQRPDLAEAWAAVCAERGQPGA